MNQGDCGREPPPGCEMDIDEPNCGGTRPPIEIRNVVPDLTPAIEELRRVLRSEEGAELRESIIAAVSAEPEVTTPSCSQEELEELAEEYMKAGREALIRRAAGMVIRRIVQSTVGRLLAECCAPKVPGVPSEE